SADAPVKILGGFGISTAGQAAEVAPHVDAVVVGSAFVRVVAVSANPYAAVRGKMRELSGAAATEAVTPG
ncbi:MAG TPA: tryptophan synthase subunit alpha, partial [Spirochaetia bacterium]|nr:tryptophan synthase subunit alpha [Spirochaetia bacterium]